MPKPLSSCRILFPLLVILLSAITSAANGETSPIPARVQMLLFSKIWMFDRSVAENDHIVMAVLYQSTFRTSAEAKDQVIEAVRAEGLKILCVPVALDEVGHISNALQNVKADVFYVTEMRGINILEVIRVSHARQIKTITVVAGYLEAGVAIGLRVRNDKPIIVVNREAAKAEGSDLTAQLLKVATIIGEPSGGSPTP
ncbi:MAG: YfiR family protein [Thermoanaerobaculia bacterium]